MLRTENVILDRNGVRKQMCSFHMNLIPAEWQGKNTYHLGSAKKYKYKSPPNTF